MMANIQLKRCGLRCHSATNRTNEVRAASSTIWEAAALGQAEQVSRTILENSLTPKDATTGKPWACPGVNQKTPGLGFTPLHACVAGLAAVVKGVNVSPPCTPPQPCGQVKSRPSLYAHLARGHGKTATVRRGMEGGNLKAKKRYAPPASRSLPKGKNVGDGDRPRGCDYAGVCRTLLSAAADVQSLDARCRTPLALAAAAGSLEVVEMLLRAGADPRARDLDGNTPSHFAFAYANVDIAAALAREGADLEACNRSDKTPQEVAGLRADLVMHSDI